MKLFSRAKACPDIRGMKNRRGRAAGYGGCYRCGDTWDWAEHHTTRLTDSLSCFPLCETCWQELGTPEARLPFYSLLVAEWFRQAGPLQTEDWPKIKAAVEAGR